MSLQCLPSSLGSICITVWGEISFEEFKDGPRGGHLGCQNRTNLAVLISKSPQCLPLSFSLIQFTVPEQMLFQDFQAGNHGSHLGYWKGTNLAILNLHITQMPPTKFGLNLTYRSRADMVWRFSRWPPWRPSWILEWNDFSNSESLCSPMPSIKFQLNPTFFFFWFGFYSPFKNISLLSSQSFIKGGPNRRSRGKTPDHL